MYRVLPELSSWPLRPLRMLSQIGKQGAHLVRLEGGDGLALQRHSEGTQ
jgi:hypothetical protein